MTFIIDKTAGATFPNGSNPQAAPSKVLQVVNATYATATSNSTSTFTSIGLSASITPLFSTSKILILFSVPTYINRNSNGGIQGQFQIVRGSTAIYTNTSAIGGQAGTGNGGSTNFVGTVNSSYLDSPATTSATTYTIQNAIQFAETGYIITAQSASQTSTITLMEIAV